MTTWTEQSIRSICIAHLLRCYGQRGQQYIQDAERTTGEGTGYWLEYFKSLTLEGVLYAIEEDYKAYLTREVNDEAV